MADPTPATCRTTRRCPIADDPCGPGGARPYCWETAPGDYVVINGHLPDCPYIRTLRDDDPDECDCRDREGSGFYDLDDDDWDDHE